MARTKAASFDAQRAAIRDAAARLFADKGYASASIADLARACGVSKALMYHYYRDKEDLLADVALSYVDRLADDRRRSRRAAACRRRRTCAGWSRPSWPSTSTRRRATACWCRT